ncbi:transmembrane protein 14A isoform X2 [Vicugna pacos]|uniref:Transmembrane protein 14A isoform X2 n=1 Tax=Vicugna pacos TaxID=30538 RepID=A0A6J0AU01_VICPA
MRAARASGNQRPRPVLEPSAQSRKVLAAGSVSQLQVRRVPAAGSRLFSFQPRRALRAAGGVPSLIGGLFVGFLAGYGAYRVSNDKRDVKVSLFTAFFLATIMGVRFKRSKKIMPAGLVAGLSLMMILRLVLLLL